ncbi:GNAT family N-acetyltransferase [Actinomadura chibensis]|uniref:GNAT family N-acetyltransferase n=2 Tax=Actinomadura chibensis TaxID=392828 RepID=A0A5D0NJ00_9ACTN|nr:GNAT family N-acetyltransferase [Actinomadura chibensis]
MEEMYLFYGATLQGTLEERTEQTREALFGETPAARVLLAFDGDEAVGIASWSFLWPAVGFTRSLYLKELYVTGSRRGSGIGVTLMRAVFETAAEHGCSRVEWTTDTVNTHAQRFYSGLGYQEVTTKILYRGENAPAAGNGTRVAVSCERPAEP